MGVRRKCQAICFPSNDLMEERKYFIPWFIKSTFDRIFIYLFSTKKKIKPQTFEVLSSWILYFFCPLPLIPFYF